jgi:hypothetical protein
MITIRRSADRGHFDHGWLNTHHTFSFGQYRDEQHMGFRSLRVINEDRVQGGQGFGEHGHRDMEIISYVISGELAHKDSMGNGSTLRAGDLQRMSAGSGVRHSEFNASPTRTAHFYQIWIIPEREGIEPGYEELRASGEAPRGEFRLVAAPEPVDGALRLHQDARLYLATLDADDRVTHELAPGRHAWVQVIRGRVRLGEEDLDAGDGAAISEESEIAIAAVEDDSEIMLFDLA